MNPAIARKLIEKFDAALSVQLFAQTELVVTNDELDHLPTEVLFERYKLWPPRVRMSEAKFIDFLKVTCGLDVVEADLVDDQTLIVGVQLKATATALVCAKRRNAKKPPPDPAALRRAARLPTRAAAAKHLGITSKALKRLCRSSPDIGALFLRQ